MGPIALLDRGTVTAAVVAAIASATVVSVAFRLTPAPTVRVPPTLQITTVGVGTGTGPSALASRRIKIVVAREPVVSFNDTAERTPGTGGDGSASPTATPAPSQPSSDSGTSASTSPSPAASDSPSSSGDSGATPSADG